MILQVDETGVQELVGQAVVLRRAALRASAGQRPWMGSIICPLCEVGTVTVQVSHHGHVWAECDTADCISLIE